MLCIWFSRTPALLTLAQDKGRSAWFGLLQYCCGTETKTFGSLTIAEEGGGERCLKDLLALP